MMASEKGDRLMARTSKCSDTEFTHVHIAQWLVRTRKIATSGLQRGWGGLQSCVPSKEDQTPVICWVYKSNVKDIFLTSVQLSSVTHSCLTLCDPMNCSTPGLPVHHQLPEFTKTHVHWVSDAIQPSHPLSSPSPPPPNTSPHQSLFQWVNSSHEVAKVQEFQL